jgi:hypothetical protein
MGVYTNLKADSVTWDTSAVSVATNRAITRDIASWEARQGDPGYPSGYAEADEVQEIDTYNGVVSGGNFTLTIELRDGTSVTTANIVYDAAAATIETAIDVAATGNITDWTNADISVALTGNLTANAATVTFDGDSVDATNHPLIVMNDIDLAGGGTSSNVAVTTNGQSDRTALAALRLMGALASTPPPQGTTVVTAGNAVDSTAWYPRQETLLALSRQAAIEDETAGLYDTLLTAFNLDHLI